MVPATLLAPVVGLTTPWFIVSASVANAVLVYVAPHARSLCARSPNSPNRLACLNGPRS